MQKDFFFHPLLLFVHVEKLWPGTSLCFANLWPMKRIQREIIQPTINQKKRRGRRGNHLCSGFDGALFCQVASLAAVVAVHLACLAALHSNMADLTTPVTLDFVTELLDVSKSTTGVALLLVGVFTVPGHMSGLAAVVAALLPLLPRLLAVPGNVTTPVAVVARILSLFTVLGNVALFSASVAEQIHPLTPSSAPATAATTTASSIGAVLHPVSTAATSETLTAAHFHSLLRAN